MKKSKPPLVFTGITHEITRPGHLWCHQLPYLSKLKPIAIDSKRLRNESQACNDHEHFLFRSNVCAMLWLTLTRQDLIADIALLQQHMVAPQVKHLKLANATLRKAKDTSVLNGLHFRRLPGPTKLLCISDASHANSRTVYAQEGRLVLLVRDAPRLRDLPEKCPTGTADAMESHGHPLYSSGRKSTRVSQSTSASESLALLGVTQVAQLIANRLAEPLLGPAKGLWIPRPLDCLRIQEENAVFLDTDAMTDCMDVFELLCSKKGLSNDTTQRVVILSLREFRALGIIRGLFHVPTSAMLADGLTKPGKFPQLHRFCTCGIASFPVGDKSLRLSISPAHTFPTSNHRHP